LLAHPVVHLELQTANLARACAFYTELFGWSTETVPAGSASYVAMTVSDFLAGGVVENERREPAWLPYVEVADIADVTERGRLLGATAVVEPREGPAGWRAVLSVPAGAEIALWQPKL
jgi:predicted enzyme related to lactoylglutathione lyase